MRFANIYSAGRPRPCVVMSGGCLDLVGAGVITQSPMPATIDALVSSYLTNSAFSTMIDGMAAKAKVGGFPLIPFNSSLRFAPAVEHPGKILCVGLNYKDHIEEFSREDTAPQFPAIFGKFSNALAAHGEVIALNSHALQYDYEAELVVVIGRKASGVSVKDAESCIFGYTCGNDLTARDLQHRTSQWFLGKGLDHFAPVGPVIVTPDELDVNNLAIKSYVNGELRQNSRTSKMIIKPAGLVSYISQYITLDPGDIIFTGTPAGVTMGYPEDQQHWLSSGDTVEVSIEGIGLLRNTLV